MKFTKAVLTLFLSGGIVLAGCGSHEEETESSSKPEDELSQVEWMKEATEFEKEIEQVVTEQVGETDADGNERIEKLVALDGKEMTVDMLGSGEIDEDDTDIIEELEKTSISVTINTTEDEFGRHVDSAYIFRELYDKYTPEEVNIWWNITDAESTDDREIIYTLRKNTYKDINWDNVFVSDSEVSTRFVKDIDFYYDESEYDQ
ncbi:hypothetical protein JOC34_000854 [Virgibacillus halotolerans]|uniref:hypothetical protein n=1 Tax=Virgibacillus halotolerans TaxID=1071053 RepID=UPI00196112E8|nr:hypothetical protein [Virgibacillus halotolerans]MBM7598497.1 hypothetical protein [Virgibacillus halotolerans]